VWWVWLLGLLPFLLLAGGVAAISISTGNTHPPAGYPPPQNVSVAGRGAMLIGAVALIGLPFLHAVRRAREWAWWAGSIRFAGVAVACHLRSGSLIGIYWKLIGLGMLIFLGYVAIALGLTALVGPSAILGQLAAWGFAAYGVVYLLLLVTIGVLARIYTLQRVWRRVVEACAVINIGDAADVAAAGDVVNAFGEGLADGLDFGL
jgi:hypothetical protein